MPARVYYQNESIAESAYNTDTNYQDKVALTFTPGSNETWLFIATWMLQGSSASYQAKAKFLRSSGTPVDFNEQIHQPSTVSNYISGCCFCYETFGASPGSQTYKIQFATNNTGGTVRIKEAKIIAIRLEANDQKTSVTARQQTNQITFQDRATLTFTPGSQGDYLILASAIMDGASASYDWKVQLNVDGSAYDVTNIEPPAAGNRECWGVLKKVNLTAASHTIKVQWAAESGNAGREAGIAQVYLMALRLSDFLASYYEEAETRRTYNSDVNWADIPTDPANLTQTLDPVDYLILATSGGDMGTTAYQNGQRLLQDSTDLGQCLHNPKDSLGRHFPFMCAKFLGASAQSYTWKIQLKTNSISNAAGIQDARIVVLQLEAGITTKDFAGTAALTSSTPNANLKRYANLAGTAALVSTTPDADLGRVLPLAGIASLVSTTPEADLGRILPLAGTASLTTATPDADLGRYANFAGTAALVSNVPDCDLGLMAPMVHKDFAGTAALSSNTPDADLGRVAGFTGMAALVSQAPDADLNRYANLAGTAALQSVVADADLLRYANLTGTAALVSQAPDCDLSLMEPMVHKDFAGTAALATSVPDADLGRVANFAGTAVLASTAPDASLNRIANFQGLASLDTNVPEADLSRYANFVGLAELLTLLSDADLQLSGGSYKNFTGIAAITTVVPDANLGTFVMTLTWKLVAQGGV